VIIFFIREANAGKYLLEVSTGSEDIRIEKEIIVI